MRIFIDAIQEYVLDEVAPLRFRPASLCQPGNKSSVGASSCSHELVMSYTRSRQVASSQLPLPSHIIVDHECGCFSDILTHLKQLNFPHENLKGFLRMPWRSTVTPPPACRPPQFLVQRRGIVLWLVWQLVESFLLPVDLKLFVVVTLLQQTVVC